MRTLRVAVPLVAGALLVAGCGGSGTATSQTASSQPRPPGGGFLAGDDLTKVADQLGVSESKLKAAMSSLMPQGGPPNGGQEGQGGPPPNANGTPPAAPGGAGPTGPGGPGGDNGPGAGRLAAQLAKKLGVPETKVTKALQSVMPQRGSS